MPSEVSLCAARQCTLVETRKQLEELVFSLCTPVQILQSAGTRNGAVCRDARFSLLPAEGAVRLRANEKIRKVLQDLAGAVHYGGAYVRLEGNLDKTAYLASSADTARPQTFRCGKSALVLADCLQWIERCGPNTIHAVVTDPPYGLSEYTEEQQRKLRDGKGGVWRIPPSFDGSKRSPLPRFTVLSVRDLRTLDEFFHAWARVLLPALVPGANVVVASNPLVSYVVSGALARAGLERRGEIVRLVMTMRGGDRPKDAHAEFSGVSVMPRSMWEPWLVFRKPVEGRVQDNLRVWRTGGFRRPSADRPFGDVIASAPTGSRRTQAREASKPEAAGVPQTARARGLAARRRRRARSVRRLRIHTRGGGGGWLHQYRNREGQALLRHRARGDCEARGAAAQITLSAPSARYRRCRRSSLVGEDEDRLGVVSTARCECVCCLSTPRQPIRRLPTPTSSALAPPVPTRRSWRGLANLG